MGFLDRIRALNNYRPGEFVPWYIDELRVGRVRRELAPVLARFGGVFEVEAGAVRLARGLDTFDARSSALARVVHQLVSEGIVGHFHDEAYPVAAAQRDEVLCVLDRAAAAHFGIRAFGQHVNGFVRRGDGLYMWVARRAANRRTYPGMLDNLTAGGLPHGVSLEDNLVKECFEEAGIPAAVARGARPVGALSYGRVTAAGFKPDVLYCYDLELPEGFRPRCTDGEVEEFHLWPIEEVARRARDTDEFKLNCNLVIVDFLVRHGLIGPEHPDYLDIVGGLHGVLDPPP
jgi:8-oxo-dGTP pyrophosphatase MutT (NUDIX family)